MEATPKKWRHRLIEIFKKNPKTVIGVTKAHFVIHTLKILNKYGVSEPKKRGFSGVPRKKSEINIPNIKYYLPKL